MARAVAEVLSALGVHYWLDEEDRDLQRAAALGLLGQRGVVHAIERGVRHTSALLGLVSLQTVGSWWVPYEIGFARAAGNSPSFVLIDREVRLPSFARIAAGYQSADELSRWAATLSGRDLHSHVDDASARAIDRLADFVPRYPPQPEPVQLCDRALAAIELLASTDTQQALALTSETFNWLPTTGEAVAEIAYDLLAPLAFTQLGYAVGTELEVLHRAYRTLVHHYAIAEQAPALEYEPSCPGWKTVRYRTPARTWLQGFDSDQLAGRLRQFCTTRDHRGNHRPATRAEFIAEFDRVLHSGAEPLRRSLGVLLNPLFGFTPQSRPVFWRILAIQYSLYRSIAERRSDSPFGRDLQQFAHAYLEHNR